MRAKYATGCAHNHYVNSLVVGAALQGISNRSTTAPLVFILLHGVLKCAHHPVFLKYVTLWHPAASSHDFLHFPRLATIADDFRRGNSPAFWLHLAFWLPLPHMHLLFGAAILVGGVVVVVVTCAGSVVTDGESNKGVSVHVLRASTCMWYAQVCNIICDGDAAWSYLGVQPIAPPRQSSCSFWSCYTAC